MWNIQSDRLCEAEVNYRLLLGEGCHAFESGSLFLLLISRTLAFRIRRELLELNVIIN